MNEELLKKLGQHPPSPETQALMDGIGDWFAEAVDRPGLASPAAEWDEWWGNKAKMTPEEFKAWVMGRIQARRKRG